MLVNDWQLDCAFFADRSLNLVHFLWLAGQHEAKLVTEIVFKVNQTRVGVNVLLSYRQLSI